MSVVYGRKAITGRAEPVKIAQFLTIGDKQAIEIYNSMYPSGGTVDRLLGTPATSEREQNQRTLDDVLKRFDKYCDPLKSGTMEAFKFNSIIHIRKQIH